MRSYYLNIGGYVIETTNLRKSAPAHIEFEINSYTGTSASTLGYIKVYNLDQTLFQAIQASIGQNFIFQAGWADSPLTRKLGYSSTGNYVLVAGKVVNIIGNFAGTDTYCTIFYSPNEEWQNLANKGRGANNILSLGEATQILDGKEKQTRKECNIVVPPYTLLEKFIVKALRTFTEYVVRPDLVMKTLMTGGQNHVIAATSLNQLLETLNKQYKLNFLFDSATKSISVYYNENEKSQVKAAMARLVSGGSKIVYFAAEDMIAQPELVNSSRGIHILSRLKAEARIGDIFILEGNMPNTSQIAAGLGGNVFPSNLDSRDVFKLGVYTIQSITHKGEYYNPAAEAWSTSILGTPVINAGFRLL